MSSIPQDSFSPSQPEKVKTVEYEFKQNVLAGIWTKVSNGDRTTRLKNRLKVLAQHEKKYFTLSLSGWNGSVPPSTEQRFLSEIAITQDSDPRGQPNLNVKTVDQEDKQNNVGTWTEITDDRSTRLKNRSKVALAQAEKKLFSSHFCIPGLKDFSPWSTEQSFLREQVMAATKLTEKERKQFNAASNSTASSSRENPAASNYSAASHDHGGFAAVSRHGGSTASYPKSDGSLVVKLAIPVVCFSKSIPAAAAKKLVEDWAVQMKDRGLLTFKDTSVALPDVQSTSTTNSLEDNADIMTHAFDENFDSQ
jgi:hypothetical protein